MSKNLSAIKRVQISLRNNLRNRNYKSSIKTIMKKTLLQINNTNSVDYDQVNRLVSQTYSKIDKAVKKGIIAKNNAARKKSILARKVKDIIKS